MAIKPIEFLNVRNFMACANIRNITHDFINHCLEIFKNMSWWIFKTNVPPVHCNIHIVKPKVTPFLSCDPYSSYKFCFLTPPQQLLKILVSTAKSLYIAEPELPSCKVFLLFHLIPGTTFIADITIYNI